ncbi:MAG TPA: hypothetical protein VMM38_08550 [Aridibacter sp.]|nr:hypothetical protein [Aridibacter sp.]
MQSKIEREVRFLRAYTVGATIVCAVLLFTAFTQESAKKFEVIDVERINVVEKDGSLKMVISNQARQHPGIVNGKVIERDGPRAPGLLFFNHLGDEMGGLIYGENGGDGHFGSLTFDKVRNDQTMGFRYLESDNGRYSSGLEMWQQPDIPGDVLNEKYEAVRKIEDKAARDAAIQKLRDNNEITTRRLFLGKGRNDETSLSMHDIKGRTRVRISVPAEGEARIEILNEKGDVVGSFPGSGKAENEK